CTAPALLPLSLHDALPILRREPLDRVDDEDRDVRARDRLQRTQRRVALRGGPGRDAAAPPDAGRVDEDDLAPPPLQPRVDRVARSEEHTSELQSQSNLVCR